MRGLIWEESFWVFREDSGGEGSFHAIGQAAEVAWRLSGDLAVAVPASMSCIVW